MNDLETRAVDSYVFKHTKNGEGSKVISGSWIMTYKALFDLSLLRQQFIDMIYHINITINIFTLFSTVNINIIYKFNNCNININKFTLQLLYWFE